MISIISINAFKEESLITKTHINHIKKGILFTLSIYIIYALVFSVSIFRVNEPIVNAETNQQTVDRFWSEEPSNDQVVLLDDGQQAAMARINLIEQAKDNIQIAYYTVQNGVIADAIFSSMIDAANRGVKVEILLDGIFHNLRGNMKDTVYAFTLHPNIELKYYEPLNFLKPWTWNNRLHDKLMVIDQEYAIIGGRNIADKYFIQEKNKDAVKDRDVLIMNTDRQASDISVIPQMKAYFSELWNHDFSKQASKKLSNRQELKGKNHTIQLLADREQLTIDFPDMFNQDINWDELAIPTNKISFIHNPIQRMNKEPWVLSEITNLLETAENSFIIESPYIIPTQNMLQYLDDATLSDKKGTIMTNSVMSTPNPLAYSGHIRHTHKMVDNGLSLIEYEGPDSVHGKTYIFDNRLSMIGSFNLDARSSFLSTESMVVIDSPAFADHLNKAMETRFSESNNGTEKNVNQPPFFKKLFLKILSYVTALYQHLL